MNYTPQDYFYIVISGAIVAVTILLCWMMAYIIMGLHDIRRAMAMLRDRTEKVSDFLSHFAEKFSSSAASLSLLAKGGMELVSYFIQKRREKKNHWMEDEDDEETPKRKKK